MLRLLNMVISIKVRLPILHRPRLGRSRYLGRYLGSAIVPAFFQGY